MSDHVNQHKYLGKKYPKAPKGMFIQPRRLPPRPPARPTPRPTTKPFILPSAEIEAQPATAEKEKAPKPQPQAAGSRDHGIEKSNDPKKADEPKKSDQPKKSDPNMTTPKGPAAARQRSGSKSPPSDKKRITLRLASRIYACVNPAWPASKLITAYAKLSGCDKTSKIGLGMSYRGCRVIPNRTLASLGIRDNEEVQISWAVKPEQSCAATERARETIKMRLDAEMYAQMNAPMNGGEEASEGK